MTTRRHFLSSALCAGGAWSVGFWPTLLAAERDRPTLAADLPAGPGAPAVPFPHFPDRLHAFVWRNWPLVPVVRIGKVVGASPAEIVRLGRAMGLADPPGITADQLRRSALTIIRRNWHLLPYEQLLRLLDWSPEQLAFTLREDDFLFIKLGSQKPKCLPLAYQPSDAPTRVREQQIACLVRQTFPDGLATGADPLFGFLPELCRPVKRRQEHAPLEKASDSAPAHGLAPSSTPRISPRFCHSYFALYGDPLLGRAADPYPEGYLSQLAASGVDGVWLQAVLYQLAPFPWDLRVSARSAERLRNLEALVRRARRHGIGIYLYLNEPRAMPLSFHARVQGLKGVTEADHATLCTSVPAVQDYLRSSVASICRAVPNLAGFFTITGSENLTNCWSHGGGAACPRCGRRRPAEVIAELNGLFQEGIQQAGTGAQLIVWDWGWADPWVAEIIERLPAGVSLMSVSEWGIPIQRGGISTTVGEYSISTVGPGARARQHWALAKKRGLRTIAKVQAGNTWELSAVPYIPALENVAHHAANLREAGINGIMLGWSLGGYPSPNLEVVAAILEVPASSEAASAQAGSLVKPQAALREVGRRRFGPQLAPAVIQAWSGFSAAFSEFPFHGGVVYQAPMQFGPSNLLWERPTGYRATMIGFPYDDLEGWRQIYPATVFIEQFNKVAAGFESALARLQTETAGRKSEVDPRHWRTFQAEVRVAEAAAIHFRSTTNQARFVLARQELADAGSKADAERHLAALEALLRSESALAQRLCELQRADSRLGFEASNQYYYVPIDLGEKVLNCADLLERWLPAQRARWRS